MAKPTPKNSRTRRSASKRIMTMMYPSPSEANVRFAFCRAWLRRKGVCMERVDPFVNDGPFQCQPRQESISILWNLGCRPCPHLHRRPDREHVPSLAGTDDLVQSGVSDDHDPESRAGFEAGEHSSGARRQDVIHQVGRTSGVQFSVAM